MTNDQEDFFASLGEVEDAPEYETLEFTHEELRLMFETYLRSIGEIDENEALIDIDTGLSVNQEGFYEIDVDITKV